MTSDQPSPDNRKRLVVAAGSLVATSLLVALIFSLGSWAYQHRRYTLHEGRLGRLLAEGPSADQVTQALVDEGGQALPTPPTERELRALVSRLSPARVDEVVEKARKWPSLRVFGVRDMVYVLYFDREDKLRDYVVFSDG